MGGVLIKRIWLIGSLFLLSLFLISCSSNTALKVPENAEVDRIVAAPAASGNPELSVTGKQITDADEIARMLDALREMKTTDEENIRYYGPSFILRLYHDDARVKEYCFSENCSSLQNGTEYIGIQAGKTSPVSVYQQSAAPEEAHLPESIYE